MPEDENDTISKIAKGATEGAISGFQSILSKMISYPKKKYCKWKFGPKAKSKKGLRIGRIKKENSNKVYIVDDRNKKYYWIKTQKIRDELGYAGSDTNEEIFLDQVKNYEQGNPIYWKS